MSGPLRPRRILLTLDAVGGVWRHVVDLAGALRDEGADCRLAGFGPPPAPGRIRAEGRALAGLDLVWSDQPLDWLADDPEALAGVPAAIRRLAGEWRADLLHLSLPSQAAGLKADWPVVAAAHSCMPTWWRAVRPGPVPSEWEWRRTLNAHGFARADMVVVPSRSHGEALLDAYGRLPRLAVVPNASAPVAADAEAKEPFVLAAGRWWDPGKNVEILDAAAAGAVWPVVLAGTLEGPAGGRVELRHAAALGDLAPLEMRELMRSAAIFAAPSLYEPFGLAVLEAAAAGAALILSDIPTFRELWGGVAVFVAATDAAGWRAAIDRLAADEAARTTLGRLAAERARRFSPAAQLDALTRVYDRAMRARHDGPAPPARLSTVAE